MIPALLIGELVGVSSSYSDELFEVSFSTHLVVATSWLVTVVCGYVLSLVLGTRATEEQQQWMWIPVVKSDNCSDS